MNIVKTYKDYIDSINEGLIKSYPGDIISKEMEHSLIELGINASCNFVDNNIILEIRQFNTIDINRYDLLFDHIFVSIVNRGGWFPSKVKVENYLGNIDDYKFDYEKIKNNYKNYNKINIYFEENYPKLEKEIPDKLYHLSIEEYQNKILKYGLFPKSKSKLSSHLDRIYVCKNIEDCENLIPKMLFHYSVEKDDNIYYKGKSKYKKNINPVIYEIDNSDSFIKKLYIDVNYNNGYYILDNIPVSKIKKIDFNIY